VNKNREREMEWAPSISMMVEEIKQEDKTQLISSVIDHQMNQLEGPCLSSTRVYASWWLRWSPSRQGGPNPGMGGPGPYRGPPPTGGIPPNM